MFIVLLRFDRHRAKAQDFMDAHRAWIAKGFEDGVFLLVGGLVPNLGGAILAHGISPEELRARVDDDPFVIENVVSAEVLLVSPARTDSRLSFLDLRT